jgi:hypothetical protein
VASTILSFTRGIADYTYVNQLSMMLIGMLRHNRNVTTMMDAIYDGRLAGWSLKGNFND